jgi:hypothetical protein
MLEEQELQVLVSRELVDQDRKSVGYVECFFNDRNTGKPEWIGVLTGKLRHRHVLVPVAGAEKVNGSLRVPWTKEQVVAAPDYGEPEGDISEELEREAYRHYGLEPTAA